MIESFISNLTNCSMAFFLVAMVISIGNDLRIRQAVSIEQAIVRGISFSTAPTGIAFVICAFIPALLSKIEGASLSFMTAGSLFLFISVKYGFPPR